MATGRSSLWRWGGCVMWLAACAAEDTDAPPKSADASLDVTTVDQVVSTDAGVDRTVPNDLAADVANDRIASPETQPPSPLDAPLSDGPPRDVLSTDVPPRDVSLPDLWVPDALLPDVPPRDAALTDVPPRDAAAMDAGCAPPPPGPVPSGASLYGIHFVPILGDRSTIAPRPAWMGGPSGPRLWDVELIAGPAYGWYLFEGGCYDNTGCGALRALAGASIDLIVRLDDGTDHYTVPVTPAGLAAWQTRLAGLFDDRGGGAISRFARVFIVGNEPNICIEAGGAPGCAPASSAIDPGAYATAYQQARTLLRARSGNTARALVAGPSGGGARGLGYLDEQLARLCSTDVDGFALHAYGGDDSDPDRDGTFGFSRDLRRQLASIDAACGGRFRGAGVFVTEFSRGTRVVPDSDFVARVYDMLQRWNSVATQHPVVAATYFLGRGPGFDEENITLDRPNAHVLARAAFQRAVGSGWRAGAWGLGSTTPPDAGCVRCRCVAGVNNICLYSRPEDRAGCAAWDPGGYCAPPPGGTIDWVRGYNEYLAQCGGP